MYLQVYTTTPNRRVASAIAQQLVVEQLASCVQVIGPITSIYRWQQKVEQTKEWLCVIKAKQSQYKKIEQAIIALHPYEVPEIIAIPITRGSKKYLAWLG